MAAIIYVVPLSPNSTIVSRECSSTIAQHEQQLRLIYGFFNRYPLSSNSTIISRGCSSTIAQHEQQLRLIYGFFNLYHPTLHLQLIETTHGTETWNRNKESNNLQNCLSERSLVKTHEIQIYTHV